MNYNRSPINKIFLKKVKGISLIEVLIVVALTTTISLSLYKCLVSGIKIWQRSKSFGQEQDVLFFFEKIREDLNKTFLFSQIKFSGNRTTFSFPTMVYTRKDRRISSEDEYIDQIGKVEYFFDQEKKALYRREFNYAQALKNRYGKEQCLLKSVDNIEFKYLYITNDGQTYANKASEVLPQGIDIQVDIFDGQNKKTLNKFVNIWVEG